MQNLLKNIFYTAIFLVILDLLIGYAVKYPENPFENRPSSMQTYFNKGRSVTGRLKQMISEHGISGRAKNGWLGTSIASDTLFSEADSAELKVRIYGMSFSNHMGEALHSINPETEVMLFHGGGAPPNYVLSAFLSDSSRGDAEIVVLGIYASGMYGVLCNTGFTWNFEMGRPYTYSKYYSVENKIVEKEAQIKSLEQFKNTLYIKSDFDKYLEGLNESDPFYSGYLIEETIWDNSLVFRLMRKGYSTGYMRKVKSQYYSSRDGIKTNTEMANALLSIYKKFSDEAKKSNVFPVVFLINTTDFSDHLYQFSKDFLEENNIPFISTHFSAPVEKRQYFLGDGHFTKEANEIFAKELLRVYEKSKIKSEELPHPLPL